MSGRALLLLILGVSACTVPNPFFLEQDDDDDDDAGSSSGALADDTSDGDDAGSSGGSGSGAGVSAGDTCDDACGDPDRDCIDGTQCTGDLDWVWRSGDASQQLAHDVAVLSDGSLVVVGSFAGELGDGANLGDTGVDPQESDAFVLRLDPAGNLTWLRAFDGPGRQVLTAVAALPGDAIAVVGQFDGMFDTGPITLQDLGAAPGLVGALTGEGEWIFVEGIGGDAVELVDVATGPGDTVTVAGRFTGPFSLGDESLDGPDADLFAARLGLDGALVWSRAIQAADAQRVHALAPTHDGGVVLAGEFVGALAIGGDSLLAGGTDGLLLALDAGGQPTWVRALGGPELDAVHTIAVAPDGTLLIAGTHGADLDLGQGPLPTLPGAPAGFIAALDPSGAPRWIRHDLPLGPGQPRLGVDPDGRAVVVLPIADQPVDLGGGPLGGSPGALLIKLTAAGNLAWSHHLDSDVTRFAAALATGLDGAIGLAGSFGPTLALAGQSVESAGDRDVFAARLRP